MTQLPMFPDRDAALDAFERGSHRDWLREARKLATRLARQNGRVTVDDVRRELPPPRDADPRIMGAVLNCPAFVPVGFINSKRRTCHGRPIRLFTLA